MAYRYLGQREQQFKTNPARARQAVEHWFSNGDLRHVRDPQHLAKLPPEEREAWSAFWARATRLVENQ